MDTQIVAAGFAVSFIVILLFGFLWGLIRGFNKSITRLLIVVCCLVLTFFIVPSITQSLLGINLANYNITFEVNGVSQVATNFSEAVRLALLQFSEGSDIGAYVAQLVGYQTFDAIVTILPQMLLNIVLFIVIFYLLRFISMIIYWIIAGICFSKKKTAGKSRHRLLGSLIGVIQNFIIFLVLLVPCIGIINIIGDTESIVTANQSQPSNQNGTNAASLDLSDYYVNSVADNEDQTADANTDVVTDEDSNNLSGRVNMVGDVIDAYKNSWVYKFLNAVKLTDACNLVFDKLTTVKYNDVNYTLSEEVSSIASTYATYKQAYNNDAFKDFTNPQSIQSIQTLIDKLYEGKLTSLLVDELVKDAATKLSSDEDFMGFNLSDDMAYVDVIRSLLSEVSQSNDVHKQLIAATSTLKVLAENKDILDTSSDSISLDKIGNLLEGLASDEAVFDLVSDVIVSQIDKILPEDGDGDNTVANAIKNTVTAIFGDESSYETAKNEIPVITKTLDLVQNTQEIKPEDATEVVSALADSEIIYNLLTSESSDVANLLQSALDNDTQSLIHDAIDSAIEQAGNDQQKVDKLNALYSVFEASNN